MESPRILVTGATGYIASRLIPRLLDSGYRVRCLAREPQRLKARSWSRYVEVIRGDVTIPSTLRAALEGIHTAYYLIHNMTYGHGYTALELDSAHTFASAAAEASVEHIIYLGGLADPEQDIAPHMRSRIETGQSLRAGNVPVTEFRAGVIIGSGSISFEMIRFMTELFPLVPGPLWMRNRAQPIAIRNVIDYLLAALTNPDGRGGVFEIGGPEVLTYKDLMLGYARIRGLKRRMVLLPAIPLWLMALGVDWMTPVPYPIAYALIHGLSADSLVKHLEALKIFPEVKLIDFDTATRDALEKTHPRYVERIWDDQDTKLRSIKHEGCFINPCQVAVRAAPEPVLRTIRKLVEEHGWVLEVTGANEQVVAYKQNQIGGKEWIEWRVGQTPAPNRRCGVANLSYLTQTVFFSPRGLPGFLYWYLLYPFHLLKFRGLIKAIARQSETQ